MVLLVCLEVTPIVYRLVEKQHNKNKRIKRVESEVGGPVELGILPTEVKYS